MKAEVKYPWADRWYVKGGQQCDRGRGRRGDEVTQNPWVQGTLMSSNTVCPVNGL